MWFIRSQAGVSKLLESTRNTLMIIFVCKLIRFKITKESTVYILINSVFLSNILFNHKSNERFCFISSKMLWTIFPRKSFFAKYFWIIWFVSHFVCADNQDLMLFRLLQHKPVMFSIRVSIQSNRVTQILKRKKNVSYNNYKKNKNLPCLLVSCHMWEVPSMESIEVTLEQIFPMQYPHGILIHIHCCISQLVPLEGSTCAEQLNSIIIIELDQWRGHTSKI